MSMHKLVDGRRVDMTPEEESATRAEWAARTDPAHIAAQIEARAQSDLSGKKALRAAVEVLYALIPNPKPPMATVMDAIKARYKELIA